ncbi:MAG: aminoglycoside phosphotransferase family protein [Akkermansiaceae bacterium]|nr:aminoglycoside phosphotransferase family protein [Akkermansiaceae bacterium]
MKDAHTPLEHARHALDTFEIPGRFVEIQAFGNGLINDTYVATFEAGSGSASYILQRINHHVFQDPASLMANVERVCHHIRYRLHLESEADLDRRCLSLVPTKEGASFTELHDNGSATYWRCFDFIQGCSSFDVVETPEQAYQAARKFGEFQRLVSDIGGCRLAETIPDFHNTPKRFQALVDAIAADPLGRVAGCQDEIEFALRHEAIAHHLLGLHARGLIPERVTHNDTKLSNVLIDDRSGEGVCVVDLDTVMPGLCLYDFGDLVRTCVSPVEEDSTDLTSIQVRMPVFRALARGFLKEMVRVLTPSETANLAFSGKLLTYEVALRFLTDHILGDTYFGAKRPDHNLQRARNQFQLVRRLEALEDEMNDYVDELVGMIANPEHRLPLAV